MDVSISNTLKRVETYTRWEDLEGLRAEWNAFNESSGGDVFGSYDWCRTWWEFYGKGRKLDVRVVRSGSSITAIFRLFREKQWLGGLPVRFVRLVGSGFGLDVGKIAIAQGSEDEAIGALAESMAKDWDVIHLGPFMGFVDFKPELVAAFKKHFTGMNVKFYGNVRPYVVFDLSGSFEDYLKQVEKFQRKDILRREKILVESHKVEYRVRETKEDLLEALPAFFESHERLWRNKDLKGYFNEWPDAKSFHAGLIERLPKGSVFIAELMVDGSTVAQEYCFRSHDILHCFQPTRKDTAEWNKSGIGNILFFKLIDHIIATGAKMVDCGGPPIDYKVRLGGRVVSKKLLMVVRGGVTTQAKLLLHRVASWVFDMAYARIWHRRLVPALRITEKPYLRAWIRSRILWPK